MPPVRSRRAPSPTGSTARSRRAPTASCAASRPTSRPRPPWRRRLRPWRRAARREPPPAALPDAAGLAGAAIELGRSARCQLVFADDSVSRHHAVLHVRDGAWFVRDQGSLNGTWVNGRRVMEAEVRPGDELRLGELAMRL